MNRDKGANSGLDLRDWRLAFSNIQRTQIEHTHPFRSIPQNAAECPQFQAFPRNEC